MVLLQAAGAAGMSDAAQLGIILGICAVAGALMICPVLWWDAKKQRAEEEARRKANERYQHGGNYYL